MILSILHSMDTKSKVLVVLFLLLFGVVVWWRYHVFFIEQDYLVYGDTPCETETMSCFVATCEDSEDECDKTPYLKIQKNASQIAVCNGQKESCPALTCSEHEADCAVIQCNEETVEEGEECLINE